MPTFTCTNCGEKKQANPRLKGDQKYCGDQPCQRARKAEYQRTKMAKDADYRAKQIACVKKWQKHRPLHQYMKEYRENHPEYVERNRLLQRIRNQKRHWQADLARQYEKIVKMDTFESQSIKTTTYIMTPYEMDTFGKIVKMDAFLVELKALQPDSASFLQGIP